MATNTNGAVTLSSNQPIDDLAAHLMETVARKGRGFVLDTAAHATQQLAKARMLVNDAARDVGAAELGEGGAKVDLTAIAGALDDVAMELARPAIEVRESLPPHDEWQPPAAYRSHSLADTGSFIKFALRYGAAEKSLVFYGRDQFTLVLDEGVDRGEREVVQMRVEASNEWREWEKALGRATSHKGLLQFLMEHEHNLVDGEVLKSMASLRLRSEISLDSDVRDEGKSFGITVKTNAGEELKRFPKQFAIAVPVLAQDVDRDQRAQVTIRLQISLPDEAKKGPEFTLYCPEWENVFVSRIQREGDMLNSALDGWTVVHGVYATRPRVIGR
jgi:hypothetical protein